MCTSVFFLTTLSDSFSLDFECAIQTEQDIYKEIGLITELSTAQD